MSIVSTVSVMLRERTRSDDEVKIGRQWGKFIDNRRMVWYNQVITKGRRGVYMAVEYPYYEWLESVMTDLASERVKAISLEIVNEEGEVSTQYWNCNRGDRALMMAAMEEAQIMDTLMDNRDILLSIIEGEELEEEEEEDGD